MESRNPDYAKLYPGYKLVDQRYLLTEDAERMIAEAAKSKIIPAKKR